MSEPSPTYQTATPTPRFPRGTLTLEGVVAIFTSYYAARRDGIMRELAELEKHLGYGRKGKPTTSRLRELWRQHQGQCPHCGRELEG